MAGMRKTTMLVLLLIVSGSISAQCKRESLKYAGVYRQNELVRFTNGEKEAYAIFFHFYTGMYFKDKAELVNTLELLYKTKEKGIIQLNNSSKNTAKYLGEGTFIIGTQDNRHCRIQKWTIRTFLSYIHGRKYPDYKF